MAVSEAQAMGASPPVVVREREHYVSRSHISGHRVPRWPIRRSEWLRRIYIPVSCGLVALVDLMAVGGREWRVGLLLFWVLAWLGTYLGWTLANLLARVTISDEEVILRLRYTLRARPIPKREVRRLVRCTVRSGFGGRYPLLVMVGDGDRTLAQIGVDHYTDEDLTTIADAVGIRSEGTWEYMPSVTGKSPSPQASAA
jgi:hypothetical protein